MEFLKNRSRPRILTVISVAALILLAFITLALANLAGTTTRQKTSEQFQWDTEQISDRIQDSLNGYSNILYSGRAFILNSNVVEADEWTGYFRNQDIFNHYKGMSTIAYISLVTPAQKGQFEAQMRADYGNGFTINPAGSRDMYAAASLIVSGSSLVPNGFDVYSTPDRRAVYEAAKATGQPTASTQYAFASGIQGLFVALPVTRAGTTEGFVIISMHSDDFFESAISPDKLSNFAVKVTDVTDKAKPEQLYASSNWKDTSSNLSKTDTISFGGRTWSVEYQAPTNYNQSNIGIAMPYLIMGLGFLLVCVIALCFYIFLRIPSHRDKVVTKRVVNETTTTTIEE